MSDGVIYIFTITLLVALGGLAFWIARQSLGFEGVKLFQSKPKRLGVMEITSVDSRRRLVLIRRDNVEHLIMTGGPVDVVIETGIAPVVPMSNGLGSMMPRPGHDLSEVRHSFSSVETQLPLQREQTN